MKRTIYGKITNHRGSVNGLKVQAWEEGWAVDQEVGGGAVTNEDGKSVIKCEKPPRRRIAEAIQAWQGDLDSGSHPDNLTRREEAMMQMVICLSGHSIMPLPDDFPERHGDQKA